MNLRYEVPSLPGGVLLVYPDLTRPIFAPCLTDLQICRALEGVLGSLRNRNVRDNLNVQITLMQHKQRIDNQAQRRVAMPKNAKIIHPTIMQSYALTQTHC